MIGRLFAFLGPVTTIVFNGFMRTTSGACPVLVPCPIEPSRPALRRVRQ